MPSPRSSPRIVAESLQRVLHPGATALRAGPPAAVASVARAIAHALLPPCSTADPPAWLKSSQHAPFRRAVHAFERHGGALLALPVGSGKTWLALAVARHFDPEGVIPVLVPAPLRSHWQRTALALETRVEVVSHAMTGRGKLPRGGDVVIIDESHHFRNPLTRRYAVVAPWLVGRRALLLSATPVVNRLNDLASQLLLTVRDDALAASGIGSLALLLASGMGHPALSEVVIA